MIKDVGVNIVCQDSREKANGHAVTNHAAKTQFDTLLTLLA